MTEPLSCRELVDVIDGAPLAPVRERIVAHLAACPDCSTYAEQIRTTVGVLGGLRDDDVSEPALAELVRTFNAAG